MYQLNSGLLSSILMVRVTLKHESEKFFLSFIGDVKTVNMTCETVFGVFCPLLSEPIGPWESLWGIKAVKYRQIANARRHIR